MPDEVRYHMLRPEQALARRTACSVAYVPIGTLEWHGPHNPYGTDTLQAEGIALMCAQKGGGLVFPPLYYGENRLECLMEARAQDRDLIAREMGLPPENFTPDRQPFSVTEQTLNYNNLLIHILAEIESLGFELGILVAGHYPLIDHARAAVLLYNQRNRNAADAMLAWAFVDYLLVKDKYAVAGDHAGGWETSHMMALHPSAVDLSKLPPKGGKLIGCGGKLAPQDSTAEFGRETLEAAADVALREVRHRLENKKFYRNHGNSLCEGLWRTDTTH